MASLRRVLVLLAGPVLLTGPALLLAPIGALAPPASAAGPVLTIVSSKEYTDPFAGEVLAGQIRNTGDGPAGSVRIDVTWLDAAGNALGAASQAAIAAIDVLGSGDASPFAGTVTPPAGWRSYTLAAVPTDNAEALDHAFTVRVTSTSTDADGFHHLLGTVTNNNAVTVGSVTVVATLLDNSGQADDLALEASPANPSLGPGATGPFDLISNASGRPYTSYEVLAQSPTGSGASPAPTMSGAPSAAASPAPSPSTASPSESAAPAPAPGGGAGASATGAPAGAAAPSVSLSPAVISAGQRVTVTYRGTPGARVQILARTQPAAVFTVIGSVVLDRTGVGTSTHAPQKNTRLTARTTDGIASPDQPLIQVRSLASLAVVHRGPSSYTFSGRVYPARPQRLVSLYRGATLVGQARCTGTGSYTLTRTLTPGRASITARTSNDSYNLGTSSPPATLTVH